EDAAHGPAGARPRVGAAGAMSVGLERGATLLDAVLPRFDFGHFEALVVNAPPAAVAAAAERYDLTPDGSPLARLLVRLRGLRPRGGTLREALGAERFTVLVEDPGTEIVFGIAGRFWALNERANLVATPDAAAFVAFDRPGFAKAAMSIRFDPLVDGG